MKSKCLAEIKIDILVLLLFSGLVTVPESVSVSLVSSVL